MSLEVTGGLKVLIESAFLKLPELLLSNFNHGTEVEYTIVHLLALALQMELNALNIPRPFSATLTEKPYDGVPLEHRPVRADLYVDLSEAIRIDERMKAYGVRAKNWLEVKAPLTTGRRSRATLREPLLVRDCLRLCLLPEELPGSSTGTENGRYLLWLLDTEPRDTVPSASWVHRTLDPGVHESMIEYKDFTLEVKLRTLSFEPHVTNAPTPLFWGYLVRIGQFKVRVNGQPFISEDTLGRGFDHAAIDNLKALRNFFLAKDEMEAPEA